MRLTERQLRKLIRESLEGQMKLDELVSFGGGGLGTIHQCKGIQSNVFGTGWMTSDANDAVERMARFTGFPLCDFINIFLGDVPESLGITGDDGSTIDGGVFDPHKIRIAKTAQKVDTNYANPVPETLKYNSTARLFPKLADNLKLQGLNEQEENEEDTSDDSAPGLNLEELDKIIREEYGLFIDKMTALSRINTSAGGAAVDEILNIIQVPVTELDSNEIAKSIETASLHKTADKKSLQTAVVAMMLGDAINYLQYTHNKEIAPDLLALIDKGILDQRHKKDIERNKAEFKKAKI